MQILIVAASQPHLVLARQDRICGNRGPAGGPPTPQRGLQLLPHCWGQGGGGGEDFEKGVLGFGVGVVTSAPV